MVLKRPKYASKISPTLLHHQRQAELWIILTLPFDRSSRNAFPFFCCPIMVSPCELKSKCSVLSWQLWCLVWSSASGCSSAYLLPIWVVVALLWHQQGIVTLELPVTGYFLFFWFVCKFGSRSNLTLRVFTRCSLNCVIGLGEGGTSSVW